MCLFFFKQKTAYEMRISDWSSDVCSSDLPEGTEVQSAKFGRTRAFIWQDPEPASIWRGEPNRIVGHMPVCFWRYVVSGEMSSMALTEAGAKAKDRKSVV